MALELHDTEVFSPSEKRRVSIPNGFGSSGSSFSGLSSPFGSELSSSSTETESDDDNNNDDFLAELTRQMADYMLEEEAEDDENALKDIHHSDKFQSTKYGGPSSIPAHGYQSFSDDQSRAVHLYKLENQPSVKHQGSSCWGKQVKKTELTQNQHKKPHHVQNRGRRADAAVPGGGGGGGFGLAATAWPPLQRQQQQKKQQVGLSSGSRTGTGTGTSMRAVFLGGSGPRSGSCGTGVFLPRATSNPMEIRKKSECSTVLIPARVIQALQQHFEDMHSRSQSNSRVGVASHQPQHDAGMDQSTHPAVNHNEMDLPQEWTY